MAAKYVIPKLHSLAHSMITVASLETKLNSAWPPFYNTRINSLVGCAFWDSDKCAPSALCSLSN